ncbi:MULTISPECIES: DUF3892 domain-containing protein [Pedobacter]|jgi:uncharacterized OB-fold protein|uniref:Putative OB-fold protein n=1 Tax=Pedobacter cryoconitis TaxID=188932 RepID=A0A7X0J6N1_9SPHI|nr:MULTISPECIES: DUF3892 domain-containing protein [Pedobacter]ETZ24050.1 hypothetical protein N824_16055 [Pedobacter sp. V48]MBB6500832.1 putative OB-fold protein [Pedobacter cryoconitis]
MAEYRISGVWKNSDGVITAYAFHTVTGPNKLTRAQKKTKAEAIATVELKGNHTITWLWNYKTSRFELGEKVTVVGTGNNKYLRSNPDNQLTDNLGHLINFDWIAP